MSLIIGSAADTSQSPTPTLADCSVSVASTCTVSNTGRYQSVDGERCYRSGRSRDRGQFVSEAVAEARVITRPVPQDPASYRCFRGATAPRFVTESEQDCAEILEFYGVPWEYEPVTFVLETDEDGRVTEAFCPDFYLPEQNLFLEVTTMRQELVTRKNRKVRKLRQRYPDVNVKLFYKRDIEALGRQLHSRGESWQQQPVGA